MMPQVFATVLQRILFFFTVKKSNLCCIKLIQMETMMKKTRLFVLFILLVCTGVSAQKTGDTISGAVSDSIGPMMMVNITERDSIDRIVAHAITDANGEFSFRLKNPNDRIQVSYVGYETVDMPITGTHFEVLLKVSPVSLKEESGRGINGLPLPLRKVPDGIQTINMEEFEGLGMTFSTLSLPFDDGTTDDEKVTPRPVRSDVKVKKNAEGGVNFHLEDLTPPTGTLSVNTGKKCWEKTLGGTGVNSSDFGIVTQSSESVSLVYFERNAVFEGFMTAFDKHYSLVLSPDMIWLLISQGIATHINGHAEKLGSTLVDFEGKKTLKVITERNLFENLEDLDWIIQAFSDSIEANTNVDLAKLMTCSFSTTGLVERISSQITLMESVKKFFKYEIHLIGCGIPNVTLLGTPDDWKEIRSRLSQLDKLGMHWWRKELEPILDEFVNASQNHVNKSFWLDMVGKVSDESGTRGGCLPTFRPATYDGWFTSFFPFSLDYYDKVVRTPNVVSHETKVCSGVKKVDVLYCIDDDSENTLFRYDMELWAGFIGMELDRQTNTLKPEISWMLRNKGDMETAFEKLDEDDRTFYDQRGDFGETSVITVAGELTYFSTRMPSLSTTPLVTEKWSWKGSCVNARIVTLQTIEVPSDFGEWCRRSGIRNLTVKAILNEEQQAEILRQFPSAVIVPL